MADHYDGAAQTLALFDFAAHDVVDSTRLQNGDSCALDIYSQFIEDPEGSLDLSCIDLLEPVDFDGGTLNSYLLGTSDAWGDG